MRCATVEPASKIINYNASQDLTRHLTICTQDDGTYVNVHEMHNFQSSDPVGRNLTNTFNDLHALSLYLVESIDVLEEEYTLVKDTRSPGIKKLQAQLVGESGTAADALTILLMTGIAVPAVETWIKEDLTERLIRKWEKSAHTSLESIRTVVIDSCLPVCDRLIILLMNLRSIATKSAGGQLTGLELSCLDLCIHCTTLLIAQLHMLLRSITRELDMFTAFCKWLIFILARMSADDETPDAAMPCEFLKVATYIREDFTCERISHFFGRKVVDMERYLDTDIDTLDPFPKLDSSESPTLLQTRSHLVAAVKDMLIRPAALLQNHWRFLVKHLLTTADNVIIESHFTKDTTINQIYIALIELSGPATTHSSEMLDNLCVFLTRNALSTGDTTFETCRVIVERPDRHGLRILDAKFMDNSELLLLLQSTNTDSPSQLVAFNYADLPFTTLERSEEPICSPSIPFTSVAPTKVRALAATIRPVSLAINGTAGRRTGMYLQADRQRYTVFDLDTVNDEFDEDESSSESYAEEMEED